VDSDLCPSESEVEGQGLGTGWEEGTRLGIAGKGCEVSIGERAAWKWAPLGR